MLQIEIALYKQLFLLPKRWAAQSRHYARLAEVGRLEAPKLVGKYETGQLILHRVFGYRGVVLFPWLARVYDRDLPPAPRSSSGDVDQQDHADNAAAGSAASSRGEVRGRTHLFYQVLIDQRDSPYIRAQTEAVTFLGGNGSNSNSDSTSATSRSLYAIPGLDYVAHEDIIPWSPSEQPTPIIGATPNNTRQTQQPPLQHELFERFLRYTPGRDPPYVAQETLRAWHHKNHPWLELSDVHKETTERVRVTVIPFYMGCRETHSHNTPASGSSGSAQGGSSTASASNGTVYWWRYCIRLENLGPLTVQLRERHWRIFSLSGTLETVRGRGVVGQEPALTPHHSPAFQYSSHVSLQAPSGHMWGTFRLEREDGYAFDCRIPPFSLESKAGGAGSGGNGAPPSASSSA